MSRFQLVHLATIPNHFEARVLAARLGAEGVVWELRGMSSVYPIGSVDVFVEAEGLERARELVLAAAVNSVFADSDSDSPDLAGGPDEASSSGPIRRPTHPWTGWALAVGVFLLIVLLSARPLLAR